MSNDDKRAVRRMRRGAEEGKTILDRVAGAFFGNEAQQRHNTEVAGNPQTYYELMGRCRTNAGRERYYDERPGDPRHQPREEFFFEPFDPLPQYPRPPVPRQDQQRYEQFYRQCFRLAGSSCLQNQCYQNRENDPFCLCHFDDSRITAPMAQRPRVQGRPAGLRNLGNTCYMNSFLQTLFHMLPVRRILYQWRIPPTERRQPGQQYNVAIEFRKLFARLQSTNEQFVSPEQFVIAAGMNHVNQQDAQEFASLFLNWLDHILAERQGEEKLQSLFKGKTRSIITCRACQSSSTTESVFRDFSLPVNGIDRLGTSLEIFFADEQLDSYNCVQCGKSRVADKRLQLTELPQFLNLHLLRYHFNRATRRQEKLTHGVMFPRCLDMRPFLTEEQIRLWGPGGCTYELMAILIHLGGAQGGHYYARARVATDGGRWYTFNDEYVSPYGMNEMDSDARGAYLLVYERERDVERKAETPQLPHQMDLQLIDRVGVRQIVEVRKALNSTVDELLISLKVKPGGIILWLPTEWLLSLVSALKKGPGTETVESPDMSRYLCYHGRLAHVHGLKAVDARAAEQLLNTLNVVPVPFFVDGSMFCEECAFDISGATNAELSNYDLYGL